MATEYSILLTEGAEQDLEAIHGYIAEFDDPANADHVLDPLVAIAEQLAVMPERSRYPRESPDLGIKDYCQVFFKPYCLIYRVMGRSAGQFLDLVNQHFFHAPALGDGGLLSTAGMSS